MIHGIESLVTSKKSQADLQRRRNTLLHYNELDGEALMGNESYNLFLDDVRSPACVTWPILEIDESKYNLTRQAMLPSLNWVVVRDYYEFTKMIEERGLPEVIAFDHDLADLQHQIAKEDGEVYEGEMTGNDCAQWLVNLCFDTKQKIPNKIYVHSMNPVGGANIVGTIVSGRKHLIL